MRALPVLCALLLAIGCASRQREPGTTLVFPGSAVGAEARLVERQIARFERAHPGIHVVVQPTPDAADQRHQLYVQWLNAHAGTPDVLSLDVVWTPELAAAGWLQPLDRFHPETGDFFDAPLVASRWRGKLYAMPWFVDVGMLYYRTDVFPRAPATLDELRRDAIAARRRGFADGFVWQGARYEGLVTGFQEILGGFGGRIADDRGNIVVDSPAGVRALDFMRGLVGPASSRRVLGFHEEQARFAFSDGRAALMRNWPYARRLIKDQPFAVAPMPAGPGGEPTAALGGAVLAVNASSRHPAEAWQLVKFLTAPEQMRERRDVAGELPARRSLYSDTALRAIVDHARPRPPTPLWSELSGALSVHLHRALLGEESSREALSSAAAEMRAAARPRVPPAWARWSARGLALAPLLMGVWLWRKRSRTRRGRDTAFAAALVAPAVGVVTVVALFPLLWAVFESLHVHDLRAPWRGSPFTGLDNYALALASERFRGALAHTALFVALSVTLELALGLALALLLDRAMRGRALFRSVALLPWAMPTVVAALVWRFLFQSSGAFASPLGAWLPLVLADVWKTTPFVALLLLAGLQTIDPRLLEAARVDGAGPWRRFLHVTLPLLRPVIAVALVFRTLDALRVFDLVYVLTNGGPGTSTEPLALYAWQSLLTDLRFGYGSALGVIVFALAFGLALVWVRLIAPTEGAQ